MHVLSDLFWSGGEQDSPHFYQNKKESILFRWTKVVISFLGRTHFDKFRNGLQFQVQQDLKLGVHCPDTMWINLCKNLNFQVGCSVGYAVLLMWCQEMDFCKKEAAHLWGWGWNGLSMEASREKQHIRWIHHAFFTINQLELRGSRLEARCLL